MRDERGREAREADALFAAGAASRDAEVRELREKLDRVFKVVEGLGSFDLLPAMDVRIAVQGGKAWAEYEAGLDADRSWRGRFTLSGVHQAEARIARVEALRDRWQYDADISIACVHELDEALAVPSRRDRQRVGPLDGEYREEDSNG